MRGVNLNGKGETKMSDYICCTNCGGAISIGETGAYVHEDSDQKSCEFAEPCKKHKYKTSSWSDIYGSELVRQCSDCGKVLWHKPYGTSAAEGWGAV